MVDNALHAITDKCVSVVLGEPEIFLKMLSSILATKALCRLTKKLLLLSNASKQSDILSPVQN